jgi:phosphate:Na+ symporter
MGIGFIFFGLMLMADSFSPLKHMEGYVRLYSIFSADNYLNIWKCILLGCALTMIVQSSSATIGITIGLAISGAINFNTAIALVMGENIGTTITGILASLGMNTDAKRAAYFHAIFKVIGVIWLSIILPHYAKFIGFLIGVDPNIMVLTNGKETFPHIALAIAMAHSVFNITNTLVFLPFTGLCTKLMYFIIRDKPLKQPAMLVRLNEKILDTPALAILQSHDEIVYMSHQVELMLNEFKEIINTEKTEEKKLMNIFQGEQELDVMQKEVIEYLSKLLITADVITVIDEARHQIRIADEYESVSDYIASLLKLYLRHYKENLTFHDEIKKDLLNIHNKVYDFIMLINHSVKENEKSILPEARNDGDYITHIIKDARHRHLLMIGTEKMHNNSRLILNDMLNAYRKIKDHCINIAEAMTQ